MGPDPDHSLIDEDGHPLYTDCNDLTEDEINYIERQQSNKKYCYGAIAIKKRLNESAHNNKKLKRGSSNLTGNQSNFFSIGLTR